MRTMKKFIIPILLLLSLIVPTGFAQNTTMRSMVSIQHWTTANGVPVYFVPIKELPMLDVQLVFAAGSAYDGQQWGLSSLVNNMIAQSTTTHNSDQIADISDSLGMDLNAQVDRDMGTITMRTLTDPKYFSRAIDTFVEVATQTNFPAPTVERIKNQMISQIQSDKEDTRTTAERSFTQAVYRDFPYGHPINGTVETIKQITIPQLEQFYRRFYNAGNAKLVMVGAIAEDQAKQIAERIASALPAGQPAPTLSLAPSVQQTQVLKVPFPAEQATLNVGQIGITPNDPDYFPLFVGNSILGESGVMTAILFREIREKRGLAYFAYSALTALKYNGVFVIKMQTKADQADQALQVVQQTLNQYISQGPTQEQLDSIKKYLIGNFPTNIASNKDILQIVTNIVFYNRPLDFLDHFQQNVSAVTAEQIKAAFNKKIVPNKLVTVIVGPQK